MEIKNLCYVLIEIEFTISADLANINFFYSLYDIQFVIVLILNKYFTNNSKK